jgi:hypothetical protein
LKGVVKEVLPDMGIRERDEVEVVAACVRFL